MAEAAGLALGVFPVCITLIQSYQQGRSIFRDMRDYRRVLKEFRRELQVEHCKFEQSLYSVFGETMTSDECAEVFKNPEQAEQKLNATLRSPSLVQSFIDSVVAMRNEVESIKEKLEATGVHAGKNADGSAQVGSFPGGKEKKKAD